MKTGKHPDELKAQLDADFEAYKNGEKSFSKEELRRMFWTFKIFGSKKMIDENYHSFIIPFIAKYKE